MKREVAVLITCHNRRENTLACLTELFDAKIPDDLGFSIYLVDDGSTDGTGEAVKKQFPSINVIQGTGNLFWNQGMRLAWSSASKTKQFDFYIWLNDDTVLKKNAIIELLSCFEEATKNDNNPSIIVGACSEDADRLEFSYGGRNEDGPVLPNGKLQTCRYINGNVVLIPEAIYESIGNLSREYSHGIGDNDYGLRAIQSGFKCYTTKEYVGICPSNKGIPDWINPKIPFKERWKNFHSPRGLNIKEYSKFRRKFWKKNWSVFVLKAYLRMMFPRIYSKIKKGYGLHLKGEKI